MEEGENYTSLQEFTEDATPGGDRPNLQHSNGIGRPEPGAAVDSSPLSSKLNSMRRGYIQLCEDYTTLGQSCSKTVKQCREYPGGWLHVGDQCFYFSSDKLDWPESRDRCAEIGGHLAILHTMAQHVSVFLCERTLWKKKPGELVGLTTTSGSAYLI